MDTQIKSHSMQTRYMSIPAKGQARRMLRNPLFMGRTFNEIWKYRQSRGKLNPNKHSTTIKLNHYGFRILILDIWFKCNPYISATLSHRSLTC